MGQDVINAQRLQSAVEAGQILITESNYHSIKEPFNCSKVGEVNMKNKKDSIVIYEVHD